MQKTMEKNSSALKTTARTERGDGFLNEKYLSFLETRTRAEKIGCGVRPMRASSADIKVESN